MNKSLKLKGQNIFHKRVQLSNEFCLNFMIDWLIY